MKLVHYYRSPGFAKEERNNLLRRARAHVSGKIQEILTEYCFNVEITEELEKKEEDLLSWLLRETFEPDQYRPSSFLEGEGRILEVGPRLSFNTAWCTNAVSICRSCGLSKVSRIERSRRYLPIGKPLTEEERNRFLEMVHDRMTETPYPEPLSTFETGVHPEPTFKIPLLEAGRSALERLNRDAGLAFDDWDLDYYTDLFCNKIRRNPTNVECFDIAQSNSEHSRHWFFKGRLIIDGDEMKKHLIEMLQEPLEANPNNSIIAFNDNSSAIRGYSIDTILPSRPGNPSPFQLASVDYDLIFTAETHNFPSGVAPFPGAETGTGGRIRDVHATGRGSLVVAGTAAYCVGNLNIPEYPLPWEDPEFGYPSNLASPLQIEIEASNGASDYGNKFGEPVIQGYTRSFGLRLPNRERREWIKPIMFSGGIGQIAATHTEKEAPEVSMWVVKIGGPAYRIGMGGGAASSMVQGENVAELDFNAVQRGDAEMEQKVNRVIRACVELGPDNPIVSIHDQGAGGNCNVLKELVDPKGARINIRAIPVGDETLSVLEIWGAEYQENDALLLRPEDRELFVSLCEREKVPAAFVGSITGDGKIVVNDPKTQSNPVDLELEKVLGKMPQKTFSSNRARSVFKPLEFPKDFGLNEALSRVLKLLSVGSKRFLTNKVDRCVTGLVARQQCAGPLQLTVADVAVIAQSHFGLTGGATAIGEQPIKGLLDPAAMARMSLGEALTNLVWARVSSLEDIKCSGNWMWAAKLPGEGAALYDAAAALRDGLLELGIGIDGGKDSLSMAALAPKPDGGEETVKAPGSLVLSAYVTCPNIEQVVTPDFKAPGKSVLLFVPLGGELNRLGGSALAHALGQLGDVPPDVDLKKLRSAFEITQSLIEKDRILAGHDRSDGGLVTAALEMAFSGNCGLELDLEGSEEDLLPSLFSEELGLLMEVNEQMAKSVRDGYEGVGIRCLAIGRPRPGTSIEVRWNGTVVLQSEMPYLRQIWEETSYELEKTQANPECIEEERESLPGRTAPPVSLSFTPEVTPPVLLSADRKHRVAIVREEGSNGDREMASAFFAAGFEPWDVTMSDLMNASVSLQQFRGVVFVGGFSYADVLDSAKGWAGVIRFNDALWKQFEAFYQRSDTFSLGVCNGCQLMALLGWVPWRGLGDTEQPRFVQNRSGRFESRFSTVRIDRSPSIMLRGMEGSTLGIWVAHGEGRAYFPEGRVLEEILGKGLAPVRYVDDSNEISELYPFNPNGSPAGIAGMCSTDGRHLVMMPHPERTFLKWQWPWMPRTLQKSLEASPWLRMFQNARTWCNES